MPKTATSLSSRTLLDELGRIQNSDHPIKQRLDRFALQYEKAFPCHPKRADQIRAGKLDNVRLHLLTLNPPRSEERNGVIAFRQTLDSLSEALERAGAAEPELATSGWER